MEIKFKRVHTWKDLILSVSVLAAGIGVCFIRPDLGFALVLVGLLLLLFCRSAYRREGDPLLLKKKAFDVAPACRASLKDFLEGKDIEPEATPQNGSSVVWLRVYYNRAVPVAYARLYDFSDFNYEPATDMVELRGVRAEKLIGKL